MKSVSIIVPVYNVEKYLKRCLDSLINQTYTDIEIIIVDDGSTDCSAQICDNYLEIDNRIRVFHKENRGQGSARNYGIDRANGEYIMFIDSDDWLREDTIEYIIKRMLDNKLDMLMFSAETVLENPDISKNVSILKYERHHELNKVLSGLNALETGFRHKEYHTSICMRIFRTSFLRKYKIRFNEKYIHEDEDFGLLSYIYAKRVMLLGERFYYRLYRSLSTMTSLKPLASIDGYCYSIRSILNHLEKCNKRKEKELCIRRTYDLLGLVFKNYYILNDNEKNRVEKKIKDLCRMLSSYVLDKRIIISCISVKSYYRLRSIKKYLRHEIQNI